MESHYTCVCTGEFTVPDFSMTSGDFVMPFRVDDNLIRAIILYRRREITITILSSQTRRFGFIYYTVADDGHLKHDDNTYPN